MKLLALGGLAAALVLSGCSTTTSEQRRALDEEQCAAYGFRVGSDAFASCLLQLDLDRREARRQQLNSAPQLFPRVVVVERSATPEP